jgi:uncharacterized protein
VKVAIHLTHDCNLRCTYCYIGEKDSRVMTRETAEAAVRFAFANSFSWVDLSFFGGEPLMEKDLLWHTLEYAQAWQVSSGSPLRLRTYVTTNGLFLDEPFLARARVGGLNIAISLDGDGEVHDRTRRMIDGSGSFQHLEALFPLILAHDPFIDVLCTFTSDNVTEFATGIARLHERGFRNFFIGPDIEQSWSENDLAHSEQMLEQLAALYERCMRSGQYIYLSCLDGKIASHVRVSGEVCACCDKHDGEIAVAPSGNIYPCLRFVKNDTDAELLLGHVVSGLDRKKRAKIMLEAAREAEECVICHFRGRCFHYCSALNFKTTRTFNRPPPGLCRHEQMAIRVADQVAARLYHDGVPAFLARYYGHAAR